MSSQQLTSCFQPIRSITLLLCITKQQQNYCPTKKEKKLPPSAVIRYLIIIPPFYHRNRKCLVARLTWRRVREAAVVGRFWHVLCHKSHFTLNNRMKTKKDSSDEGEHLCIKMAPLLALAVSIHSSKHGKPSRQQPPRSDE